MRGELVTMMLEPNYCLQHRDLWDLVTSRPQLYWKYEDGEGRKSPHIHPLSHLIFSSNVSDCLSPISWKPSYWVHLTYHRISFHVLPSQRARCSIEWVNKMQHTAQPQREDTLVCRTEFQQMSVNDAKNATRDGSSSAIITDDPELKLKDQRWFVASLGPWDP